MGAVWYVGNYTLCHLTAVEPYQVLNLLALVFSSIKQE
jgi:hypothetical protein